MFDLMFNSEAVIAMEPDLPDIGVEPCLEFVMGFIVKCTDSTLIVGGC